MVYSKSTAPTAHTNVMSSTVTVERRLRGRERFACFCVMICISSFGFICRSVFVGFADFIDFVYDIGRTRVMTASAYSRPRGTFSEKSFDKVVQHGQKLFGKEGDQHGDRKSDCHA